MTGAVEQKKPLQETARDFAQDVRREALKVTWPSRRETGITTMMVFVMVVISSIFFLLVDQAAGFLIRLILGWGG